MKKKKKKKNDNNNGTTEYLMRNMRTMKKIFAHDTAGVSTAQYMVYIHTINELWPLLYALFISAIV